MRPQPPLGRDQPSRQPQTTPVQYSTAAELLLVLLRNLDDDTPSPNSVNTTGEGGTTAQWHLHGYNLEIFCEPDRIPDYYLKTPDTE